MVEELHYSNAHCSTRHYIGKGPLGSNSCRPQKLVSIVWFYLLLWIWSSSRILPCTRACDGGAVSFYRCSQAIPCYDSLLYPYFLSISRYRILLFYLQPYKTASIKGRNQSFKQVSITTADLNAFEKSILISFVAGMKECFERCGIKYQVCIENIFSIMTY